MIDLLHFVVAELSDLLHFPEGNIDLKDRKPLDCLTYLVTNVFFKLHSITQVQTDTNNG